MSHSPYEPEGVGTGVGQGASDAYEVGTEVTPGSGPAYGETYVRPVEDDLYAPLPEGGASAQGTGGTSAGDVKDTAADQGRRVADTAKEQASQVKDTAVEQGQQVAAVAKDEAGQVAQQAATKLKDLVAQSRTELTSQVGTSQNRLAEYVHSLSDELGTMASGGGDGTGPLADLAKRYAKQGGEISHWLSEHEPSDVLNEVTRFARRRPWAFLGASLLAGVVVGRVTRSLAAEAKDEHDAQQATSTSGSALADVSGPDYVAPATTTGYGTTGYATTGYDQGTTVGQAPTGYPQDQTTGGYAPGYVPGDLPENPAPQGWTGGAR